MSVFGGKQLVIIIGIELHKQLSWLLIVCVHSSVGVLLFLRVPAPW
jgi:hypothetical protein